MDTREMIKARLMNAADLDRTLNRMARQVVEHVDPGADGESLGLIGLQSRGIVLAHRLCDKIMEVEGIRLPVGVLDTTLYRDDYRIRANRATVRATDVPFDVTDRHVVLIDDVLFTGRTLRAALDALLDLGRPASVRFLVLIDRGHREIPVCADLIGRYVPTSQGEEVRVHLSEQDGEDGVWLITTDSERLQTNGKLGGGND
jgi:pyrimidine operon attenuation protein/uracil phosphoribosyltransferase